MQRCSHNFIAILLLVSTLCIPVAAWTWSEFLQIITRSVSNDPPEQIADMVRTADANIASTSFPNRIDTSNISSKPRRMSSPPLQFPFSTSNSANPTSDLNTSVKQSEFTKELMLDAFPSTSIDVDISMEPDMSMDILIESSDEIPFVSSESFLQPTPFAMGSSDLFVESTSPPILTESTLEPTALPTIDLIEEDVFQPSPSLPLSEIPYEIFFPGMEISLDSEMSNELIPSAEAYPTHEVKLDIESSVQPSEPATTSPEESTEYELLSDESIYFSSVPSVEANEDYNYAASSTSMPLDMRGDLIEKRSPNFTKSDNGNASEIFTEESPEESPEATLSSPILPSSSSEEVWEEGLRSFTEEASPQPSQNAIPLPELQNKWDEFYMRRARRSGSSTWRMRSQISNEPIDIETSDQPIEGDPMNMGEYDMKVEGSSEPIETDPMMSSEHPYGSILLPTESIEASTEESEIKMSEEPSMESLIRDAMRVKSEMGSVERGLIGDEDINAGVTCTMLIGKKEGKRCEDGYVCVVKELGTGTGFLNGMCELESNDVEECGLRLCTNVGSEGRCIVRMGNEEMIETTCGGWVLSETFDCGTIRCNGKCERDVRDSKGMSYCNRCLLELSSCASGFRLIAN